MSKSDALDIRMVIVNLTGSLIINIENCLTQLYLLCLAFLFWIITTPAQATPDATTMGWSAGITIIGVMLGIGVWTAVRKH